MSFEVMAAVIQKSKSKNSQRLVLLALANSADINGCGDWPDSEFLKKWANCSKIVLENSIEQLVSSGELSLITKDNNPSKFKINIERENLRKKTTRPSNVSIEKSTTRPRNVIWDAVLAACGVNPMKLNSHEKARYGKVVKMLNENGATVQQIFERAKIFKIKFSYMQISPMLLVSRWSELDPESNSNLVSGDSVPKSWDVIRQAMEEQDLTNQEPKQIG
jgi:hypothetical protein